MSTPQYEQYQHIQEVKFQISFATRRGNHGLAFGLSIKLENWIANLVETGQATNYTKIVHKGNMARNRIASYISTLALVPEAREFKSQG